MNYWDFLLPFVIFSEYGGTYVEVCQKHPECNNKQLCISTQCKDARPVFPRITCRNDTHCWMIRFGGCRKRMCWTVLEDNEQKVLESDAQFCRVHEECSSQQICIMSSCVAATPLSNTCTSPAQCPSPFACKANRCWTTSISQSQCDKHDQCPGQQICVSSSCVVATPFTGDNRSCTVDQQCPWPNACKLKQCWIPTTVPSPCQNHDQCMGQQICVNSVCVAAVPFGITQCTSNTQCPFPNACKSQRCWVSSNGQNQCQAHNDCVGQMLCSRSACVPAIPVPNTQCSIDTQCLTPSTGCKFGTCWSFANSQSQCTNHDDCSGQQLCSNFACVPATPIPNTQCSPTFPCSNGAICKFQTCWTMSNVQNGQCRNHDDCNGQQLCSNFVCVAATPIQNTQCSSHFECPAPNCCKFRMCWNQATNNQNQCRNHNDCNGQYICSNSACVAGVPIPNSQCASDVQCSTSAACKFQTCWNPAPVETQCQTQDDCRGQFICSNSVCVAAVPVPNSQCSSNFQCTSPAVCKFQTCWNTATTQSQCRSHTDCNGQQICSNSVCVPAIPVPNSQCRFDAECTAPAVCKFFTCFTAATFRQCRSHVECPDQQICVNSKCVAAIPAVSSQCTTDSQCLAWPNACKFQICWTTTCQSHVDCDGQYMCSNSRCTPASPVIPQIQCQADNQCGFANACKFQICWTATPQQPQCRSHNDCSGQNLCSNGVCTVAVPVPNSFCSNDNDCIRFGSNACKFQICWTSTTNQGQCRVHTDCDSQRVCSNNNCIAAIPVPNSQCNVDRDCVSSGFCKFRICWTTSQTQQRCNSPTDQPVAISNGNFQTCSPPNVQCSQPAQCSNFGVCCITSTTDPNANGRYGQSCSNGICFDANTICVTSKCACSKSYYFDGRSCSKRPLLNEPCGMVPSQTCATYQSECVNNRCACVGGYFAQGQNCIRNRKLLNGACSTNEECGAAFTQCVSGRCICKDGFIQDGQNCRPTTFTCPSGEPIRGSNGREIECDIFPQNGVSNSVSQIRSPFRKSPLKNITQSGKDSTKLTTIGPAVTKNPKDTKDSSRNNTKRIWPRDTCSIDQYCQSYIGSGGNSIAGSEQRASKGYCCSRPVIKCPAGNRFASSDNFCNNCPKDVYFCYTDSATGGSACCPKPCATGDVYTSGQCLPTVQLGLQCIANEQCTDKNSRCGPFSGSITACICSSGYINVDNTCVIPICTPNNGVTTRPLTDSSGQFVRCNQNTNNGGICQAGFTCNTVFNVCCPNILT